MLELRGLCKTYEGKPLLHGVSLNVGAGETLCLLGPSGGGKTTLLRIVAGLEEPEAGQVLWNGVDITRLPTHRRSFGLMFQDYALFPHRDVAGNVAFGLRMRGLTRNEVERRTRDALDMVNLRGFDRRRVDDLSGGEQQRVALARTLAPNPDLLMLDEPLGALDRSLRSDLTAEMRRLFHRLHIPILYVTHDQEEAFSLATRAALLHDGRIVQSGTPAELSTHPVSSWVAKFLALGNLLPARVIRSHPLRLETDLGTFPALVDGARVRIGDTGWVLLRPDGGRLETGGARKTGVIRGKATDLSPCGASFDIVLRSGPYEILFHSAKPVRAGTTAVWRPPAGLFLRE
jgi:ABC-type Fe3+/spermidine/putrescine transport system ATPase subunit